MGYELVGQHGIFHFFGCFAWMHMLSLARAYGWQPMGACPKAGHQGGGDTTEEGAVVTRITVTLRNLEDVHEVSRVIAGQCDALRLSKDGEPPVGGKPPADVAAYLERLLAAWPPRPEWANSYRRNNGAKVCDLDALGLATALEAALPDLPDHFALESKSVPLAEASTGCHMLVEDDEGRLRALVGWESIEPREYFSGPTKQKLRDFIAYCQEGGFRIG